jgi:molybdopterin-containing oxidoreductase family molybdopterin binding subunit
LGTHTAGRIEAPTALQLLSDMAAKYTPEYTSRLTDVPASQVVALAKLWGSSKPLAVRVGFGLSHWYHGDLHMQALLTLQAITGNIGVHGGGVTTFAGGITTSAFDFLDFWAPKGTKLYTLLEPMDFCSAVEESKPFPVKAAWFMIDNFAQQMSDRNRVIAAMKQLEFVVVSDYNLSATADLADVILPACTYFEKTDLLSSNNFYLQYMPKIIDPLFESRSDLDAISMVAEKMGFGQYFNQTPEAYLKQMLRMGQPDVDPTVKGLTWEQLTTDTVHLNTDPMPYVPFFNQQYPTKSGKIEFYVEMLVPFDQELCDHKEPVEASPTNPLFKKYPLVFLSTHTRFRTHSQFVNLPWLKELNNGGDGFLEINPRDAAPRGIADGAVVRIFNDRGEMKVRARLTESMKPGVVNCYQGGWDTIRIKHYIEGHPNNLTHQIAKPAQALIPNFPSNAAYYDCLVQVEQAGA